MRGKGIGIPGRDIPRDQRGKAEEKPEPRLEPREDIGKPYAFWVRKGAHGLTGYIHAALYGLNVSRAARD